MKKTDKRTWALRLIGIVLTIVVAGLLLYGAYAGYLRRHRIDVLSHLDAVVATVDGEDLTLEDLGFYILFEEHKIEEEALIYNEKRTKDFWNTHTNGFFLQGQAREAVIEMAIHDRIFYREATAKGVALTTEERALLESRRTDFWADLFEEQRERIPGTYETVNRTMLQLAVAEKYQRMLAEEMDVSYGGLNWEGYDYGILKDEEHDVHIHKKVWQRVILGDITLVHGEVSYLNAFDE